MAQLRTISQLQYLNAGSIKPGSLFLVSQIGGEGNNLKFYPNAYPLSAMSADMGNLISTSMSKQFGLVDQE